MNQDSKLLSICIPTHNGEKYIGHNIDIMINQIKEFDLSDIEIIVSDNCSTDKIPEIMNQYVELYPDIIKFNRNNKNLGFDGNVMKLCSMAKGKYIHLFGDDDFYAPTGLKRLHDVLINNENLSILVLSNFFLRETFYGSYCSRKGLNNRFIINDKIYDNDSNRFILDVEDRAWPNTNIVFRKEYYEQIP